jgi:glycosyltransferase involved in cell wall biosynthesis
MPRVSIGLPFYNSDATLSLAIRSVFAQTVEDWELLLLDDGSSDAGAELVRALRDPRVRLISDGRNLGLPARLNEIARLARAQYLARMDADDLMHPERLEHQLACFEMHPDVDIIGTGTYTIDGELKPCGVRGLGPLRRGRVAVLRGGMFIHPTVMMRTRWSLAHPYSTAYPRAEDFELWCRVADSVQALQIGLPLHFYREPVPVNLTAYRGTSASKRRVVAKYGPPVLGGVGTAAQLLKTALGEWAYRGSVHVGLQRALVASRSTPMSTEEKRVAATIIENIRRTRVPGWEDGA